MAKTTIIKRKGKVDRIKLIMGLAQQAGLTKEEIYDQLRAMTGNPDASSLAAQDGHTLRRLANFMRYGVVAEKLKPMRAKVVAILCDIGYIKHGQPDYERINAFCETRTKAKKMLMRQSYNELIDTVSEVRQYQNKVRS